LARAEICNNGIDDDLNGVLDDGCNCSVGATQPCYDAWPAHAGVGMCTRGVQTCVASGSIGRWGACEGTVRPGVETCGDGLDNDCDGEFDEDCSCVMGTTESCFIGAASQRGVGACVGGVATCDLRRTFEGAPIFSWGACVGAVGPTEEVCDGVDDDCDGDIDDIPEVCDLVDNDCDGEIDEGGVCSALLEGFALSRFWPPTGSGVLPAQAPLFALKSASPTIISSCEPGTSPLDDSPGLFV